jgi:hypothetical protein
MRINRRQFMLSALAAAAAASLGGVALTAASGAGGTYAPIRKNVSPPPLRQPPAGPPGDMVMQLPNGGWTSHLLPFAAPFPDQASAQAEVARSRALGLFR